MDSSVTFRDRERGSIILVVLIMVCLASMVMSTLWGSSIEWALASGNADHVQAFASAESGLDHAFALLDDGAIDFTDDLAGPDGKTGTADDGRLFDTAQILGDSTYDVIITDNDDGDGDLTADTDGIVYLTATGAVGNVVKKTRVEIEDDAGTLVVLSWRAEQ